MMRAAKQEMTRFETRENRILMQNGEEAGKSSTNHRLHFSFKTETGAELKPQVQPISSNGSKTRKRAFALLSWKKNGDNGNSIIDRQLNLNEGRMVVVHVQILLGGTTNTSENYSR